MLDVVHRERQQDSRSPAEQAADYRQSMETANGKGWTRLHELLVAAEQDPLIAASPGARAMVFCLQFLAGESADCFTAEEAFRLFDKSIAVMRAKERHQPGQTAKSWVLDQWQKEASAYGNNKSEFARHYAARCLRERNYKVTDRTIREDWLRGA